jgi:hypothetical protein
MTSNLLALDARKLKREGWLKAGTVTDTRWSSRGKVIASIQLTAEPNAVTLAYNAESKPMKYPVRLDWTACAKGGKRAWFLCPAQGCGRRVAILYGGAVFACRHCHRLAYECQHETSGHRAISRADKIRERLGWKAGIANPPGTKPKGMHWNTYYRLMREHNKFAGSAWAATAARFGLSP